VATHSEFEELVVLWITASCYLDVNVNPLCLACQSGKKAANIFLSHVSAEPFSVQNFIEFGESCERKQETSRSQGCIKRVARLGIGQE
jgi:hypothetical protein